MKSNAKWIWLWSGIILSGWPILAQLFASDLSDASVGKRIFTIAWAISIFALPFVLFPRLWIAVASLFSILAWGEAWHLTSQGSLITEGAWASVIYSNPAELSEFARTFWPWTIPAFVSAGLVLHCAFRLRRFRFSTSLPILSMVLLVPALSLALDAFRSRLDAKDIGSRILLVTDLQLMRLDRTFPFGDLHKIHTALENKAEFARARERLRSVRFHAQRNATKDSVELVVFVVGEATRSDRMDICGAPNPTNPRLSSRPDPIWFCNTIAPANLTHKSIPRLMARTDSAGRLHLLEERSLVRAFAETGYRTAWISNQPLHAGAGVEVQLIAHDADTIVSLNENFDARSLDRKVLGILEQLVRRDRTPLFVVVHLMGCHLRYNWRHPPEFERFRPALQGAVSGMDLVPGNRTAIVNSYDNALLELDHTLDGIIDIVEKSGKTGIVLFVPDHGENLFDPPHERILHGSPIPTRQELVVPMMMWATGTIRATRGLGWESAVDNRKRSVCAVQAMPTLLDASGIWFPGFDSTQSLLGSRAFDKPCSVTDPSDRTTRVTFPPH